MASTPRAREIPEIPPEFIIRLPQAGNKEYITANGLIYLAHLQGLKRVTVQELVLPTRENPTAIVRCEVETDLGVFSDFGEVSPANQGGVGGKYPLSMATTRARNRALRIATCCPLTSYEEMGMEAHEDEPAPKRDVNQRTGEMPYTPAPSTPVSPPPPSATASKEIMDRLWDLYRQTQIYNIRIAEPPASLTRAAAIELGNKLKAKIEEAEAAARGRAL